MQLGISEILNEANNLKYRNDRINYLRSKSSKPLLVFLQYSLHPSINWVLPKGKFPYKKNDSPLIETSLLAECRRLYLFVETPEHKNTLTQSKREILFVQTLEMISEKDSDLLSFVKDNKKLPYDNLTYDLIAETFPGLIPSDPKSILPATDPDSTKMVKKVKPKVEKQPTKEKLAEPKAKKQKPIKQPIVKEKKRKGITA